MIQIDIDNRTVLDALNELLHRTGDLAPAMQDIGGVLESRVRGRFETETDPGGAHWAPWADSYDPAKGGNRPTNGNTTILDLYGDMLGSLSWQADQDSVTVGFGQPYAAYHEFGTKKMKRRGLLFDDPTTGTLAREDEHAILDIVRGYLAEAL
jgi:phage virion morphogenesis protein